MEDTVEIFVRHGDRTLRAVLQGDAIKDIEDMRTKIGTDSIIEAIIYSVKILVSGLKEVEPGKTSHAMELPNGKKIEITLTK